MKGSIAAPYFALDMQMKKFQVTLECGIRSADQSMHWKPVGKIVKVRPSKFSRSYAHVIDIHPSGENEVYYIWNHDVTNAKAEGGELWMPKWRYTYLGRQYKLRFYAGILDMTKLSDGPHQDLWSLQLVYREDGKEHERFSHLIR